MRVTIVMCAALCAAGVSLAPAAARADDKAAAEDLFLEGRRLIKAGKTAEACDAFARSHELDAQFGTLFNLANCLRDLGKTASAWGIYRELAQRDTNAERRRKSKAAAADLEPRLTRMLIVLESVQPGVTVLRDGTDVTPTVGRETTVDPGEHTIVARADGHREWTAEVKATGEGATVTVTIPPLERLPPSDDERGDPDEGRADAVEVPVPGGGDEGAAPRRRGGRARWPLFVAGGGVLAVGGGVVLGVMAGSTWREATDLCGEDLKCPDQDTTDRANALGDDAALRANLSTLAVGVGVAAIGAGVILYLVSGDDDGAREHALRVTPVLGPDTALVTIGGSL